MSRLMTISELYALLLHEPKALELPKNRWRAPIVLNRDSPMLWMAPRPPATPPPARPVPIAERVWRGMEEVAAACGITEIEAWTEAAQTWIVQRQRDMEELASPAGQALSSAVRHVWSVIDDQMGDLRRRESKG